MTPGGVESPAMVSDRRRVPCTRLLRIRAFLADVHRPITLSPAKCTTASTPSSPAASIVPAEGSQPTASSEEPSERVRRRTRCPLSLRAGTSADPMSPVAPLTSTSKPSSSARHQRCRYGNASDENGQEKQTDQFGNLVSGVTCGQKTSEHEFRSPRRG